MKTYNFNPNASKFQIKKHIQTLDAIIQYYENRGKDTSKFRDEKSAMIKFYYNGEKKLNK